MTIALSPRRPRLLAAAVALGLAACGDMPAPAAPDPDAPPPPGQGVQYLMTTSLGAGQETERCRFFTVPPEGLNVNRDQVRYTPGSHHVLLYATPYTSVPTMDQRGQAHDTSGVFDCAQGATADWTVTGVLAGAQSLNAASLVDLPQDVAIKVPGGTVLLLDAHYLNASADALTATVRINLYTIPYGQVKQEGGVLLFYNPFIRVPGPGQSSARMRCPITQDINLVTVQSHMHRRGVGYVANWLDGQGNPIEQLYQNTDWQNVPVTKWDPGKVIKAGTSIDYRCDYLNSENRVVLQGGSTRDEMCVLAGSYYPLARELQNCSDATYVGTGAATCAQTLGCLQQSSGNDGLFGCVVASCPGAASALTAVLRCQFSQGNGACQAACQGGGAACQQCIAQACQQPITECGQAACGTNQ